METLQEREARIAALEERRSAQATGIWPTPDTGGLGSSLVKIAPGRSVTTTPTFGGYEATPTALARIDDRPVSFARLFQSQPRIGAAVMRMLYWAVRVPLKLYRLDDSDDPNAAVEVKPGDHPLATALQTPWDRASNIDLIQGLLGPLLVNGNSVGTFQEGASGAIQFTMKDWRFAQPIMPWRGSIEGFTFDFDNPDLEETASIDKCLHVKWWSAAGPFGTSPLQMLGISLQIEDAAQRYQKASFRNGARPPSSISASDAFLGLERGERQQILKNLREDVTTIYTGPDRAGIPAVLPPGLTWTTNGQTTIEAALIEQRTITANEIAGVYQIFPMLLADMGQANYSNLKAALESTYTDTLGPVLSLIAAAINSQFVWPQLRDPALFVRFDLSQVSRGNRTEEIENQGKAVASGLATPNQGLAELGKPRSDQEGMDDYYLPIVSNLAKVGTEVAPKPDPVAAPDAPAKPGDVPDPSDPSKPTGPPKPAPEPEPATK